MARPIWGSRVRRLVWLVLAGLGIALSLGVANASALPASPWTGTWQEPDGRLLTLTQSGTQITGGEPCEGSTTPGGITSTGTISADGATASITYAGVACPGSGGTLSATLSANGRRISGPGVTKNGTGFTFSWTYVSGGTEPRETPTAPAPQARCKGGPWSGLWSAQGESVFSFVQSGNLLFGTLVDEAETINGTISGTTADATFRTPQGTGTLHFVLASDGNSFVSTGTSTGGTPVGALTSTLLGCNKGLAAVDLRSSIPAPQTLQGGPTTIVAPGTVSLTSLTRSKCVLVKVASARPARILVTIFSGRLSVRLFGRARVVFTSAGRRKVCIAVPFRAHTFNIRTRLNVALGYLVGARARAGETRPPPVIRRIQLLP